MAAGPLVLFALSAIRLPHRPPPVRYINKDYAMNKFWDHDSQFKPDGGFVSHSIKSYVLRGDMKRAEMWMQHLVHLEAIPTSKAFLALIEGNAGDSMKALHYLNLMRNMSLSYPELKPPIRAYAFTLASLALQGNSQAAESLYDEMKENGMSPDAFAYIAAYEAAKRGGAHKFTRHLQEEMRRLGYEGNRIAQKYFLWTIIRAGKLDMAREYLDKLGVKDGPDHAAIMLQTSANGGHKAEALYWLQQLLNSLERVEDEKERASLLTSAYSDVIYVHWRSEDPAGGLHWYNVSVDTGVPQSYDLRLNAMRCLAEDDALAAEEMFLEMRRDYNILGHEAYSTIIEALAKENQLQHAQRWVLRLRAKGYKLDAKTYEACVIHCVRNEDWSHAEEFLDWQLRDRVLPKSKLVYSDVIKHVAYSKESRMNRICLAENWLRRLFHLGVKVETSVINFVIDAQAQMGQAARARHWIVQMRKYGVKPNLDSYRLCLQGCARASDGKTTDLTFRELIQEKDFSPDIRSYNAAIMGMARAYKNIAMVEDQARDIYLHMMKEDRVVPNVATFMAVTRNLVINGWWEEMEQYRKEIFSARTGTKLNVGAYNRIMLIYSKAFPVQAKRLVAAFRAMIEDKIAPNHQTVQILENALGWQARKSLLLQTGNEHVSSTPPLRRLVSRAGGNARQEAEGIRMRLHENQPYICTACGLYNMANALRCGACDTPKPAVIKQKTKDRED